jgi:hypothetical protein
MHISSSRWPQPSPMLVRDARQEHGDTEKRSYLSR